MGIEHHVSLVAQVLFRLDFCRGFQSPCVVEWGETGTPDVNVSYFVASREHIVPLFLRRRSVGRRCARATLLSLVNYSNSLWWVPEEALFTPRILVQ